MVFQRLRINVCPRTTRRRQPSRRRGAAAVEAAFCLPLLLTLMLGLWEVGRLVQVSQILDNAAREGARYAAMGNITINGVITPITSTMVQTQIQQYLLAAGLPATAANNAQITLTAISGGWTNPSDAQPMDKFQVTVTIPSGAAFNSVQWCALNMTGTDQVSATATWVSLVDSQLSVGTQLPN